jgi:hypothetical protein
MGQLACRRRHAASCSAKRAHHAIWIPFPMVWQRRDAAEGVRGGTSITTGIATEKRGSARLTYSVLPLK